MPFFLSAFPTQGFISLSCSQKSILGAFSWAVLESIGENAASLRRPQWLPRQWESAVPGSVEASGCCPEEGPQALERDRLRFRHFSPCLRWD